MEQLQEAQGSFLDYQVRKTGFVGARKKSELRSGDIVSDQHGFIGIVRFITENKGSWIEFVDGMEGYDKDLKLKLKTLSIRNEQMFEHQRKYYGFITSLARIIHKSIDDDFPHVNMFYNGKDIFIKGSTQGAVTKRFTATQMGDQHSLLSIKLSPFFNLEVEVFDIQRAKRSSRYSFNVLRNLLVDIDLKQKQANRIKFIINDSNDYNEEIWLRMKKMFKKFNLRYKRV